MTKDTRDARIPVDKGWAWIVLAGSLVIASINTGTEKSYGIFFIEFLRMFKGTVFMTVMINTVLNVVYCFTATAVLMIGLKRLSVRTSVFLGITLCALGYGISSLATGLEFLIASQSILVGIGIAFHNPPIYILLGEYFDKKKGLANAVFISGNALGGIIMPPIYRYVFDEYGLRGGLIITAGITFNSLVAAALLRPTEFYTKHDAKNSSNLSEDVDKDVSVMNSNTCESNSSDCQDQDTLYPLISTKAEQATLHHNILTDDTSDAFDRISHSSVVRYLSNGDLVSASFTSLTGKTEQHIAAPDEENSVSSEGCLVKCRNKIDCYLMTNILYLLFLAIYCFGNVAAMCAHIYVPTYAKDIGVDDQRIAIIVSITCMADFVGRIVAGFLADQSWISPQQICILAQVVVGVVLQFTEYYTSFWRLLVFVVIFGSTSGMTVALFPPILIEIVGKKRYRSAMALFIVCMCLFEGTALPILGYFRDVTHTFHFTFHVMGGSSLLTVVLLIIFEVITRKQARKRKECETDKD
ncbi:monocarboxylate transporter 5-like [Mizuhopecten yessoensis]|uniref:Monocarboxylate transporter 5 n=1 Tax=Mizuhopecten yessoensis TaxID=6573 RepID=A0A210QLR4_MIZYE|nr:monocarboxylate transporter 5-like [Mizuhopecten yessoensis]OWF49677.1 Monocarboxylate transporter 5 [Mizuhopecten yessoensis]